MAPRLLNTKIHHYHTFTAKQKAVRMTHGPWIRKPLWTIKNNNNNDGLGTDISNSCSSSEEDDDKLRRHLTLFDLVCVGVGGTIGSGIFVLCGLISHSYAGPATFLSWGIAGMAACLSGVCFAELSGRIPSSGSSYIYSYVAIGELPAFLSAACLTLEYMVSGAAVARSWGDKVVEYLTLQLHFSQDDLIIKLLNPGWINPMAFLVSLLSLVLLVAGIKESKRVTNFMSTAKVLLVAAMCFFGFFLFHKENWTPFIPSQFGLSGIFRGATSSFFGYIGYDEVCCLAGEAMNPRENLPKAVLWVIAIVTILSMTASVSLIGMQPYQNISDTSGFPAAFQWNGLTWAAQLFAVSYTHCIPLYFILLSFTCFRSLLFLLC
jgi:APA family basic amino acid/polyamine antiporter